MYYAVSFFNIVTPFQCIYLTLLNRAPKVHLYGLTLLYSVQPSYINFDPVVHLYDLTYVAFWIGVTITIGCVIFCPYKVTLCMAVTPFLCMCLNLIPGVTITVNPLYANDV